METNVTFDEKEWIARQELILSQEIYECSIPGCKNSPAGGQITYELPEKLCAEHWLAWRKLEGGRKDRNFGPNARKARELRRAEKKGMDGEKRG